MFPCSFFIVNGYRACNAIRPRGSRHRNLDILAPLQAPYPLPPSSYLSLLELYLITHTRADTHTLCPYLHTHKHSYTHTLCPSHTYTPQVKPFEAINHCFGREKGQFFGVGSAYMLVYIRECDASMVSLTAIWICYSRHLYCVVLFCVVLYCIVLCCIVYCVVLYRPPVLHARSLGAGAAESDKMVRAWGVIRCAHHSQFSSSSLPLISSLFVLGDGKSVESRYTF